jgi:tRNA pseudouridine38-40 synthase
MRYLAKISYDGSKFYGFQKLNDHKSVQEEVEKALTKINKDLVLVKGAGRTDRGVHAYNQGISFDLNIDISPERLQDAVNSVIDKNIYVNEIRLVDDNFHARFDVKEKNYEYRINMGKVDVISNDYVYNYNHKLNVRKMKKASKYLVGMHSYKAFVSGYRDNYNGHIREIKIKQKKDILFITFKGKSFYRYMVRNMVGALMLVGENKCEPFIIKEMLECEKRLGNYMTVPASGLYLVDIKY